jgi:Uncharacterized conserved protein
MNKKVIAHLFIRKSAIEVFEKLAIELIQQSREEEDCLTYNLYQDILNAEEFVFIEEYRDQNALDFHFKTAYLNTFINEIKDFQSKEMIVQII